eukprot:Sspe_Gene.82426::Locus_54033_Transcript_1_1_Confidence_1.000_Length_893::g.82426::m.82426
MAQCAEGLCAWPFRQIRAVFDESTVRVYQAYNRNIAAAAVANQNFVEGAGGWLLGRMTWVKPSSIWMGYRAGWGGKDVNQERVLAVDLDRGAFEAILSKAVLSKKDSKCKGKSVVVQWDPERRLCRGGEDFTSKISTVRSIQIGLRGEGVEMYVGGAIRRITDVTETFQRVRELCKEGKLDEAYALLPREEEYPTPPRLREILCMDCSAEEAEEERKAKGAMEACREVAAEGAGEGP